MESQSIGSMIKILSEAISQKVNKNGKEFNLTMQQMKILHFLKNQEGIKKCSQKDIQDYMKISHPTTVSILRLMQSKGFIEISTSEKDRRMKLVTLTGQEEPFVKKVLSGREQMERELVAGLTAQEQKNLRRYLRRMYENVTGLVDDEPAETYRT